MVTRKITIGILAVGFILAALYVGGRWILFWQIKRALVTQVEKLGASGHTITYRDLDVNSRTGTLDISGIKAQWQGDDSGCSSGAIVRRILIKGIHLIPLIFDHKLVVDSVIAVNPQITYAKGRMQPDSSSAGTAFIEAIEIRALRIDSGAITLVNDHCRPEALAGLGITLDHIAISGLDHGPLLWSVGAVETQLITVALPTEFYEFTIQKFIYSRAEQFMRIDSLSMKPTLGHLEFAQQSGHQIDQIRSSIPRIDMIGVKLSESLPVTLAIHKVDLDFMIGVYRDTRFPSVKGEMTRLPSDFMRQMPFRLNIDSLHLHSSSVSYEEVPENGGTPGNIRFHAIAGSISNITTDSIGESIMQVNARFMDAGDLEAHFVFPMTRGKLNTVQAILTNFSMQSINSMLVPIANLEVESGALQSLHLQFQYGEDESNGDLDLRYTDLHVKSIRQNEKRSTNRVVTLLINTMVQNNMDQSDQKAKRSGTILWKRNPHASLPSYWWQSILSGLRSVYRLENVVRI